MIVICHRPPYHFLEQFKAKSKFPSVRVLLAAAYAVAGRKEDARVEIDSLNGEINKVGERIINFYRDSRDRERLMKWIRSAAQVE